MMIRLQLLSVVLCSISLKAEADSLAKVAACWTSQLRGISESWQNQLEKVIRPLGADVFISAADSGNPTAVLATPELQAVVREMELVSDPGKDGIMNELRESGSPLYQEFRESYGNQKRSGLYQWYFRSRCLKLIERYEMRRGEPYAWLVYLRADSTWLATHPPLQLLDPKSCWIPEGEDWKGVNDRYAVCGRASGNTYFRVWDTLKEGNMTVLEAANSERALRSYLNETGVSTRRFPNIFGVSCCPSWAKCQGNPRCVDGFKYPDEVAMARLNVQFMHRGAVWTPGGSGLVLAMPRSVEFLSPRVPAVDTTSQITWFGEPK